MSKQPGLLKIIKKPSFLVSFSIIVFYLLTHLLNLTALPVFADEAIYIRWSQLIIDDWQQYLFFPLNDGKTPLMMWLMVPFQFLFSDQLFAGRMLSVLVGLVQVIEIGFLTKLLGGRKKTTWLAMMLTTILPFWYFHHRMALIDALMTLLLTLTLIGVILISRSKNDKLRTSKTNSLVVITGVLFGLALLTKLPALLFLPLLPIYTLIRKKNIKQHLNFLFKLGFAVSIGLVIFFSLKIHPAFSQLFGRGSDFLFPWREVIFQGRWLSTIKNTPTYLLYFISYMTPSVLILNVYGLFAKKLQKQQHLLILSALIFAAPIILLGKVVYPRYFLPSVIFLTVSAALSIQTIVDVNITREKKVWKKTLASVLLVLLTVNALNASLRFINLSLFSSNQTPFVSADKTQYLHEWSSGHGIKESVEYIQALSQDKRVAVATEGSFGTLPDGILMYLHRRDVNNIYIEGIGFPVKGLTDKFIANSESFDQKLLIVNSHRLEFAKPPETLLIEYCRPDNAPCLQIWDITDFNYDEVD